jgi:hypothetical protein
MANDLHKKNKEQTIANRLQYPPKEDIYKQEEKLPFDEEDKTLKGEKELIGTDLDVPGAELDDEDELIGEEDEENNYYSLGGDNHEDLEEKNS